MKKIINHYKKVIARKRNSNIMEGSYAFSLASIEKELRDIDIQDDKIDKIMRIIINYPHITKN